MSNQAFIIEMAKIFASLVIPVIAFILGRLSNRSIERKDKIREQFQEFYLPYVRYLKSGMLYLESRENNSEDATKLEDLLYTKIHYADTATQKLALVLLDYLLTTDKSNAIQVIETKLAMDQLSESVLLGYTRLCKKLKYPVPAVPSLKPLFELHTTQLRKEEEQLCKKENI